MSRRTPGTAPGPPAVLCAALLVLLLYSCARRQAAVDDGAWRGEVDSVLAAQVEAWNRGDIAGYMDGYWKSDSLLFTSGSRVRRGWDETFEKYMASYDSREKMGTLSFSGLEYYRLGPEAAWVFGRWELERAGDRPGGVFTLLLRKFPGGWRVVHDHTSSEEP